VTPPSESQVTPRTLLIVDDQEAVRETLGFVLGIAGFKVICTESGESAIELATTSSIDAALIDIHMPRLNGFQTCDRLREQSERNGRALRMWVMTGAWSSELERRTKQARLMGLLRKPFDITKLVETIESGFSAEPLLPLRPPETSAHVLADKELRRFSAWRGLNNEDAGR
jgi:two-component system sensor histidine kinase RpfC